MQFRNLLFGVIVISCTFLTCSKDEVQAEKSMEGVWDVVEINSIYGEFFENGFSPSEKISESGELGTFNFNGDSVAFDFIRNDTTYTGSGAWDMTAEKVNSGFTRVTEFTLSIENHFLFKVGFEDGTKNSEKNAQSATFIETPSSNGFGVLIELSLEKR